MVFIITVLYKKFPVLIGPKAIQINQNTCHCLSLTTVNLTTTQLISETQKFHICTALYGHQEQQSTSQGYPISLITTLWPALPCPDNSEGSGEGGGAQIKITSFSKHKVELQIDSKEI